MTRTFRTQTAALLATCGLAATCAIAQPTPDAIVSVTGVGTQVAPPVTVGSGEIKWVRIDLGVALNSTTGTYLDIIGGNTARTNFDTEYFLFDNAGNFIVTDDDDGASAHSQFSFGGGCGSPARTLPSGEGTTGVTPPALLLTGASRNGADGNLAAGTYWMAIKGYDFNGNLTTAPFGVTTTSTLTGTVDATFDVGTVGSPAVTPTAFSFGTLTNPTTVTDTFALATNAVRWYSLTIPDVGAAFGNSYLDISTNLGAGGTTNRDTTMTLFREDGSRVATDFDDGAALWSALSFGLAAPTRAPQAPLAGGSVGTTHNGRDGASLAAGTYYLGISYGGTHNGTCFSVTSTSTTVSTPVITTVQLGNFSSLPPTATASASPTTVANCGSGANSTTLLTVTVTPGTNPVSSGVTVTGDLSTIGGSSTQAFLDDGLAGDAVAGDNIYSFQAVVPNTVTVGTKTINYSVADAQLRTATAAGSLTVTLCPPTIPACAAGSSILTATNLDSGGAFVGSLNPNGTATATVSGVGTVNTIRLSGLVQELNTATWATELKVRVQTPSGAVYTINPVPATPGGATTAERGFDLGSVGSGFREFTSVELQIPAEAGDGTWTITTHEGPETPPATQTNFDDLGIDARWLGLCITAANTQSSPIVSNVAWSNAAVTDSPVGPFAALPSSSILTAAVAPGSNPTSTNLQVTVDLSGVGGSATQAMVDDGSVGGDTAGDGIYTAVFTASGSSPLGNFATPISVSDAEGRTASGTSNLRVARVVDLGVIDANTDGLVADDVAVTGAGAVRWFSFEICNDVDTAQNEWFDITTNGVNSPNLADTEIGLYRADGTGVASDDDYGQGAKSALTFGAGSGLLLGDIDIDFDIEEISDGANGAVLPAGTYYLAVGDFNMTFGTTNFNITADGIDSGLVDINIDTNLSCVAGCDSIDFNNDGLFPDDNDLIQFLSVLAGGPCDNDPNCSDIDFNNDDLFPDDSDLVAFLRVLAGGECTE
jgi:hypothetical protein